MNATSRMEIKLTYGDGFSGRAYYMRVGDKSYQLGETNPGGPDNEEKAREIAKEKLAEMGISESIDNVKFTWDGTM